MHTTAHNVSFLQTSLGEMETYLLQSELFWPISTPQGVHPDFPRLTIGTVLLVLNELEVQKNRMDPGDYANATRLQTRWEALHTKWRTAVEKKALDEMGSRLNLWKAYIFDLEEHKGQSASYDQEMRQRVRFALLGELIGETALPENLTGAMETVDQRALAMTVPGDFVWDPDLRPIYPQDQFPFLYRKPKPS